jgi:hypothetical protein
MLLTLGAGFARRLRTHDPQEHNRAHGERLGGQSWIRFDHSQMNAGPRSAPSVVVSPRREITYLRRFFWINLIRKIFPLWECVLPATETLPLMRNT